MDALRGLSIPDDFGYCVGTISRGAEPEFVFGGRCARGGPDISTDTLWEAASLSKPVVAFMALERSVDHSGLLSRPLRTSAPSFGAVDDRRWHELTVQHALTHTTGFPNWRAADRPLAFESDPGSPGYSGEGYELLLAELALDAASSADVCLHDVLHRLGMSESSFTPAPEARSDVAVGHDESGRAVPKRWPTAPKASGTLHTTAHDYARFLSVIACPDDIRDRSLRAAATRSAERSLETFEGHGRTLGWAFTQTSSGDVLWQHGDNPGFKHIAAIRPSTGEAIVVFTNSDAGQAFYRTVCKRVFDVDVW